MNRKNSGEQYEKRVNFTRISLIGSKVNTCLDFIVKLKDYT